MRKPRKKPASATPSRLVLMRRSDDCMIAAVANALSWTYEQAAEALGIACHPTTGQPIMPAGVGLTIQQVPGPLLASGISATLIFAQEHPDLAQDQRPAAVRARVAHFPSDRLKRLIQGRRAVLMGDWESVGGVPDRGYGHGFGWDGARALGKDAPPDLSNITLWAALVLNPIDAREAAPEPAPIQGDSLADIFARHERVYVGFSGGRDSVALAHMCEPWREKVTLLWLRPDHYAAHMADFVRGYAAKGWRLEEIASPDLRTHWQSAGIPVDVLPVDHAIGRKEPRLQAWVSCCYSVRHVPLLTYVRSRNERCAFLTGQRAQDQAVTAGALGAQLPAHVEVAYPLDTWSDADVAAYVSEHGLELPRQYARGYNDSLECMTCPVLPPERARYLRQYLPRAAQKAEETAAIARGAAMQAVADLLTVALSQETTHDAA